MNNDGFSDQGFEARDVGEKGEEQERLRQEVALGKEKPSEDNGREKTEEEKAREKDDWVKGLLHKSFAELGISPQENLDLLADCYKELMAQRDSFEGKGSVADLRKALELVAVGVWRNMMKTIDADKVMEKVDYQVILKNLKEGVWNKVVASSEMKLLNQQNRWGIVTDKLTKMLEVVATTSSGEAFERSSPEWQKLQARAGSLDKSEMEKMGDKLGMIMKVADKLNQLGSGEIIVDWVAQGDEKRQGDLPDDLSVSEPDGQKQEQVEERKQESDVSEGPVESEEQASLVGESTVGGETERQD